MRDFFIGALDKVVAVVVVLMGLAVLLIAVMALFTGGQSGMPGGGIGGFLIILIGGGLYTILVGGMLYLGLGIYYNTKKTAEALGARGTPAE